MNKTVSFGLNLKGDTTGNQYIGTFKVKTSLSYREVLKEDEIRRTVLGVSPNEAGDYAASIAHAIAYLAVRIVDAPDFWKSSQGGLDLEDENILREVNNLCVAEIKRELDSVAKAAATAQGELKSKIEPDAP
jgi:hypothetical protein